MDGLLSGAGLPVLVSQDNPSTFLQNLNLLPKIGEWKKIPISFSMVHYWEAPYKLGFRGTPGLGFSFSAYSDLAAYLTVIDPLKTVPEDDNKGNSYMVTIKHVYNYVLKVIQKVTALVFKDGCYKLWVV